MKNVQKFVLVPIEKWEKLGQKNEPVKDVLVYYLKNNKKYKMEQKRKNILQRKNISRNQYKTFC